MKETISLKKSLAGALIHQQVMHGDMLIAIIEEYIEKERSGFYMPVLPWKWTIYDGKKIKTYGYTHTREQSEIASSMALKA